MANKVVKNRVAELVAIKARREARRISHRDLANETGLSRSSIQYWMANSVTRFDAHQIVTLCDYFGVGVDELLVVEDELPTSGQDDAGQNETLLAVA